MRWLRRLYDWVLSWADTPYGMAALALLAFAESSFFPIPPDVLLIALVMGDRTKAFKFAAVCSVASLLGGIAGYAIGWGIWQSVDQYFFSYVPGFSEEKFLNVQQIYERWDFWVIFIAAFTPIPYKVITVTAGVFGINFFMFMLASAIGRSARFFLVSGLLYLYGEPIKEFIDRRFNVLTIIFAILLVGGFYLIEFVLH
jgi:membrane protein YqaA with SNARE-associated domain